MGNNVSLLKYALLIVFSCTLCVKERDLYEPSGKSPDDTGRLGLSFKFSSGTDKQIGVMVTSASKKVAEGILVGIYPQRSYEKDGTTVIKPLYVGYTDVDGCIYAIISVPVNVDGVHMTSLITSFPGAQEADMQSGVTYVLSAMPLQASTNASIHVAVARDGAELMASVSQRLSNLYELYSPCVDAEVGKGDIPPLNASPFVSKRELSFKFLNRMNSWYPEQRNVQDVDLNKSSDLVVTDELGVEMWATYVSGGGFYVDNRAVCNVLTYCSYKEGELNKREDIRGHRITLLLSNTHQEKCPSGLKMQLLYWDGNKYDTILPEGTRIGLAVARDGLNMASIATGGVNPKSAYRFQNQTFPNANVNGFYYSILTLNTTRKTNVVTHSMFDYNCYIMGLDIRPYGDARADYDFNDMLIKLTASPVSATKPEEDISVIDEFTPSKAVYGILAFEGRWPKMGDYNLNDSVMNYVHELEKGGDSSITAVKLIFASIAKGAAPWAHIGIRIELPLPEDITDRSELEGVTIEEGNRWATFIVWNDVNVVLGTTKGYVDTEGTAAGIPGAPTGITVRLKTPVSNLQTQKFNPFIFVNSRQREIHLVDYKPTRHADVSLFKIENDRLGPESGVYYRMDSRHPRVLDFSYKEASLPAWKYPKERINIIQAYPNYGKWVLDQSNLSWFDANMSGNVSKEFLY